MSAGDPEPVLEAIESFVTDAWWRASSWRLITPSSGASSSASAAVSSTPPAPGFFASFDRPARAIRCAGAITNAVRALGPGVRAGLHTGECELVDGKIGGIAVHIGARVAKEAMPDEVLVSSTVKDLVAGSGLRFRERGAAELKGAPGQWQLFAAEHHPIAAS